MTNRIILAKACGHNCSLNTPFCCFCSDKRPHDNKYKRYADTLGKSRVWTFDNNRSKHYCPRCKDLKQPNNGSSISSRGNGPPVSRGEIILKQNTRLPTDIIKYILEFWSGDDISQLIPDWKKRMNPISDNLTRIILSRINLQYELTGTNLDIRGEDMLANGTYDQYIAQEILYEPWKEDNFTFKFGVHHTGSRILIVSNISRELVIYNKLYNDKKIDTRNTLIKYRMLHLKYCRFDLISNPDNNVHIYNETGLFTLPKKVRRKDNGKKVQVYSNSDFIQHINSDNYSSRYGQQQCDTLSDIFKKLWRKGLVDLPNNNRTRHLLKTDKSGKQYVKTIVNSHGLILSIDTNKNKKNNPTIKSKELFIKTGQELRDILSVLTNQPIGLKSSGKLTTKNAIINKIIELNG